MTSLNRVDVDGVLDSDCSGRSGGGWSFALGDSHINNIGNDIVNNGLLVEVLMGERGCNGQSSTEQSEDG